MYRMVNLVNPPGAAPGGRGGGATADVPAGKGLQPPTAGASRGLRNPLAVTNKVCGYRPGGHSGRGERQGWRWESLAGKERLRFTCQPASGKKAPLAGVV